MRNELEVAFGNYLNALARIAKPLSGQTRTSQESLKIARQQEELSELSRTLIAADLTDDGAALNAFAVAGEGAVTTFERPPWAGRKCSAGHAPPHAAEIGDLWFDAVECSAAILLPEPLGSETGQRRWLSIRPVCVWQFRTFVEAVRIGHQPSYYGEPADFLSLERLRDRVSRESIADIYWEEAGAFSVWFGKGLASWYEWQTAQRLLSLEQFNSVMPEMLRLWENGGECWHRAWSRATTDYIDRWLQDEVLPEGVEFDEWERNPGIGFTTFHLPISGLKMEAPISSSFSSYTLENAAPRLL